MINPMSISWGPKTWSLCYMSCPKGQGHTQHSVIKYKMNTARNKWSRHFRERNVKHEKAEIKTL